MKTDATNLVNTTYKLLETLYDNQVTIRGETYCPLGQDELAEMLGITRSTINIHLNKLKELDLLEKVDKSKKHILTDRAIQIVEKLENI